ncbi:NAD(P)-dependent oxidoreductase [Gordonia sp. PKS22-38]|uniref:NAD(P)-dependent oxidoreductase n=1 Tax=Gordonia prachuapensis TaxID=3115651 RepID=A0ABU7MSZ4_9ACTN|nr:NAD(P)-dependent oxidoreductase [Gordonia sp. PKS22-38]
MDLPRIGFIGPGKIGEPMIERLLAAGHPTSVYARRPEVRERLAELGAQTPLTIEAVADTDFVIACVFDDTQLLAVAPEIIDRMPEGSVFVSHTTGSPSTLRRLERAGQRRSVSVVEAPFSGTPAIIRRGELTVLLAGDATSVDRAADVIAAYASRIHRTGTLGTALSAKLINNALFAACTQLTLSALRSAEKLGIGEATLLDVLADASGGTTAARYIATSGEDSDAYAERITHYLAKDLAAARSAAEDLGVDIDNLLAATRLGPMHLCTEPTPTSADVR